MVKHQYPSKYGITTHRWGEIVHEGHLASTTPLVLFLTSALLKYANGTNTNTSDIIHNKPMQI